MNDHCCGCSELAGTDDVDCPGPTGEPNWCPSCWRLIGQQWMKKGYISDLRVHMLRGGYGGDDDE